ncbi:MAG: hypothetical protein AB7G28_22255 [Pirellulales bacterium]
MRNLLLARFTLACLLWGTIATIARADDCCCAHCGCCCPCQKVCRLVEEEKKVEVVCWGMKCEDFTVPCRSERGCKNCETVCETCGDKESEGICVEPKKYVWYDWFPGCGAQIYTRHKLMRGVTTKKMPGFKWVIEELCPDCTAKSESAKVAPGIDVPPPPLVADNVLVLPPATSPPILR